MPATDARTAASSLRSLMLAGAAACMLSMLAGCETWQNPRYASDFDFDTPTPSGAGTGTAVRADHAIGTRISGISDTPYTVSAHKTNRAFTPHPSAHMSPITGVTYPRYGN